jgi:transcriptional regulator with XRE-family HTH domain
MSSTTTVAQSGSPAFYILPSSRPTYDLIRELADRLDYQATSNSGGQFIIGSLAKAFDVQSLCSEAALVIETYTDQIFETYSGRARIRPTEIETRGSTQVPVCSSLKAFVWSSSLDEQAESTSELLVRIRAHLSLNTSELARALGVERPTIYAWMRNAHTPQAEHLARLMTLGRLARFWTERCSEPVGKWRYAIVEETLTLVDVLSVQQLDEKSARRVLAALAQRAKATPLSEIARSAQAVRERARERGWQPTDDETRTQVVRSLSFRNKR